MSRHLDQPVYIANPQPYSGRLEGASPARFEPARLPPAVGPLSIAFAVVAGMATWLLVLAFVALLGWLSAPTLADVQELAAQCKAGDLDACVEYQEAAKALLDDIRSTLREDSEREAERERLWRAIVDLNTKILAGFSERGASC